MSIHQGWRFQASLLTHLHKYSKPQTEVVQAQSQDSLPRYTNMFNIFIHLVPVALIMAFIMLSCSTLVIWLLALVMSRYIMSNNASHLLPCRWDFIFLFVLYSNQGPWQTSTTHLDSVHLVTCLPMPKPCTHHCQITLSGD